jgi:hypothetical protein
MSASRQVVRLLLLLTVAAACGGGGAGTSIGGGIGGTSSVLGPITGFGSVIVGGIEFDTDGATVTIDGSPAVPSDLKLGMVASVRGVVERGRRRGVASSIVADDLLQGPIQSFAPDGSGFTALQQVVLIDASTVFDPAPLGQLATDDVVLVDGFLDAQGRVRATRVERRTSDLELELKGFVADLDPGAQTFRINALRIAYADAVIQGAPDGLANGLFVEVDLDEPPVAGRATATDIDVLDPALMADSGDGLKVEGFVTQVVSPTEFVVGAGQRVRTDGATRFENGSAADVVIDAQVDVAGVAEPDGTLRATEVELVVR